jgi:hypothetical protein
MGGVRTYAALLVCAVLLCQGMGVDADAVFRVCMEVVVEVTDIALVLGMKPDCSGAMSPLRGGEAEEAATARRGSGTTHRGSEE